MGGTPVNSNSSSGENINSQNSKKSDVISCSSVDDSEEQVLTQIEPLEPIIERLVEPTVPSSGKAASMIGLEKWKLHTQKANTAEDNSTTSKSSIMKKVGIFQKKNSS